MEKEFVPYEIALELKQLGFDEPCFGYFLLKGNNNKVVPLNINTCDLDCFLAPLFQQAFRWFRVRHNRNILIIPTKSFWFFNITWGGIDENFKEFESEEEFSSHEEAELQCLKTLIQTLKQN